MTPPESLRHIIRQLVAPGAGDRIDTIYNGGADVSHIAGLREALLGHKLDQTVKADRVRHLRIAYDESLLPRPHMPLIRACIMAVIEELEHGEASQGGNNGLGCGDSGESK